MNTPLDYFGEFEEDIKIVVVKYFYFDSEAHIYAARLRAAGIKSFVSNSNTIAAVPLGEGGIGLHVRDRDLAEATRIVYKLDQQEGDLHNNQDFREADLAEIEYERQVHYNKNFVNKKLLFFICIIISLVILRAFLRARGWVESWWDFF